MTRTRSQKLFDEIFQATTEVGRELHEVSAHFDHEPTHDDISRLFVEEGIPWLKSNLFVQDGPQGSLVLNVSYRVRGDVAQVAPGKYEAIIRIFSDTPISTSYH